MNRLDPFLLDEWSDNPVAARRALFCKGGGGSSGGTPDPACFGMACTPANCLLAMMGGGAGASASSGSCSASPF